ncbi:alpha/beta hydrolase [Pseudorhodoferax sp.]|uniref:alpha/beta hydrolase n=1 Tax=Pseudorhodoferax sp. TaxID=1993553 RepID=UPI002DD656EE|nr:alpha/beta hydrolase [Pseudorhodoferax sp.]
MVTEPELPAEMAQAIAAMGPAFDAEVLQRSVALFAPVADKSLPAGGQCTCDVFYGPDERQSVDIYSPGRPHAPVVVFIPGGGFVRGDKQSYQAVGAALARLGCVGVVANYRLAPDFVWPSGAEDVAAIVDFVADGIAAHGGQPDHIVVVGQSAGASHVAAAMFDARVRPRCFAAVRHVALMSGLYYLHPDDLSPGARLYFGADARLHADRAPARTLAGGTATLALTVSEFDPLVYVRQGAQLAVALAEACRRAPDFSTVRQHNHISSILNIATPYDAVSRRLLGPALARH